MDEGGRVYVVGQKYKCLVGLSFPFRHLAMSILVNLLFKISSTAPMLLSHLSNVNGREPFHGLTIKWTFLSMISCILLVNMDENDRAGVFVDWFGNIFSDALSQTQQQYFQIWNMCLWVKLSIPVSTRTNLNTSLVWFSMLDFSKIEFFDDMEKSIESGSTFSLLLYSATIGWKWVKQWRILMM